MDDSKETILSRLLATIDLSVPTGPVAVEDVHDLPGLTRGETVTAALKVLIDTLRRRKENPLPLDDTLLEGLVDDLDAQIGRQLDAVLHHPRFQRLEAAWRGLKFLVDRTDFGEDIQIKLLNVSKKELHASFEASPSLEASALYRIVYEQAYDTPGGSPYGALISNYALENTPQDLKLLRAVSRVAAAAHSPFIGSVGSAFFKKESFEAWKKIPDLKRYMDSNAFVEWNAFRQTEEARFVGLVLPRFLLRLPYGPDTIPVENLPYREAMLEDDHENYLWGSAAYAFAANLTRAFATYGWAVQIRGPQAGGAVENLPVHRYGTGKAKIPVEIAVDMRCQVESAQQGLIPLSVYRNEDYAVFFSAHSAQRPTEYSTPEATTNARLSSSLPYIFLASRFMHYLKVMLNEGLSQKESRKEIARVLNDWFKPYLNKTPGSIAEDLRARRPLRDAQVTVQDIEGKPESYRIAVELTPWFQLEGVVISLSMIVKEPHRVGGREAKRPAPPPPPAKPVAETATTERRFWGRLKQRLFFWKKKDDGSR